jgi:cytochrome c553
VRVFFLIVLLLAAAGEAQAASLPPAGASSCSGCHATAKGAETQVPSLTGRNPADIEAAMRDFRSGARPATVMGTIAKGFTDDEITAIAAWYGGQKSRP